MKPLAHLVLVALFSAAAAAASAQTVTSSQGNANATSAVAGASAAADKSTPTRPGAAMRQPSKKALRKVKVTPPPPMHDPN